MSVTYPNALKVTRMGDVVTAIDAGGSAGYLEIGTAAMAASLVKIPLNYSPNGTVAGAGVLTFSGTPKSATATGTGTAAAARIRTSADVDVVTGLTVGLSASDIILDSVNITSGQTVSVTSATLTHG
jgi:hypothetical protein